MLMTMNDRLMEVVDANDDEKRQNMMKMTLMLITTTVMSSMITISSDNDRRHLMMMKIRMMGMRKPFYLEREMRMMVISASVPEKPIRGVRLEPNIEGLK